MTLFQQTGFEPANPKIPLILVLAMFQAVFALQIEAPPEIAEQVLAYSMEAGAERENAVLKVGISKNAACSAFSLELIDGSGKAIKKTERCSGGLQNAALQNAVLEIFGHPAKNAESSGLSGGAKSVLMGAGFALAGILLYYSKPPEPVRRGVQK